MPELTYGQFSAVYNALSFAIASMFASFVFFVLVRNDVAPRYRGSIIASALVVFIAGYHYFRIFNNWDAAYRVTDTGYAPTGIPFNHAYRYVDWLLTVPLLMVELALVLGLGRRETSTLIGKLVIAAFLMIGLGFIGESDTVSRTVFSARGLWGFLSSLPFAYLLYTLIGQIRDAQGKTTPQIGILLRNTGLLTLFTWGFYPIAYMAPFFGVSGSNTEVFLQTGYTLADILAKCGYGLLIHSIATLRTEEDASPNRGRAHA